MLQGGVAIATRNLARTVVEGGRATYSKLDRRARNRRERRLRFDTEGHLLTRPPPRVGGRGFADRLAPLERWLGHNVGRGWSHVYHEFCARFDRRSTKGWHLRDHLLQKVGQGRFPWGTPFFVDGRGILRRRPGRPSPRTRVSVAEEAAARRWAAGRQVIVHGKALFWTARVVDSLGPTSPQGRRFTCEELAVWSSLRDELRMILTYDADGSRRRRLEHSQLHH